MTEPQTKRAVLVLEEQSATGSRWIADLEQQFDLKRAVTVIGTRQTLQGDAIAAVVLHVSSPESRASTLIRMLRNQNALQTVPVFVLASTMLDAVAQNVNNVANVEVLDVARAHTNLRARILALTPNAVRQEEPKTPPPPRNTPVPQTGKADDLHNKLQRRFLQHSADRSQRALALCDELRTPDATPAKRQATLDEIKDLLNVMKGEATLLRLRGIADLLSSAEAIMARLDDLRRSVVVPRGVLGLLSDLAELTKRGGPLDGFDVELHRARLDAVE